MPLFEQFLLIDRQARQQVESVQQVSAAIATPKPVDATMIRTSLLALCFGIAATALASSPAPSEDLSPMALALAPDGQTLYVACATAKQVLVFDPNRRAIALRWAMPGRPSGLALTPDGKRLFVTCAEPASPVCEVETASGKRLQTLAAGHTALSPVLSADAQTLFVCNRFDDAVSMFDLRQAKEVARIGVAREPISAALTRDGRFLLVANHLPKGRNDVPSVSATISVIGVAERAVVKELRLPNGSINLRQICVSPDGRYACIPQSVGRFQLPITQLARGWVNTAAMTLVDLKAMEVLNTVVLDDVDCGAANPWASAWSPDGRLLCVTHAGTHELSVIDFPALLKKLASLPDQPPPPSIQDNYTSSRSRADVPNDLSFLHGLRRRIKLGGIGPRALVIAADRAFVADYFSDRLEWVNLSTVPPAVEGFALNPGRELTTRRRGELWFNDATICFQGWQSCASCHDDDARVDALSWDLLNDGIGNPKGHQEPGLVSPDPTGHELGRAGDGEPGCPFRHSKLAGEQPA